MTRNGAASFVLCGAALLTLALRGPRPIVVACAAIVCVLSILRLAEFAWRVDLGISEILGPSYINTRLPSRGGMAPLTAASFALASASLLLAPRTLSMRSAFRLGVVGSVVVAFGTAAVAGFWGGVTLSAHHTAVGLWVLGIGMLALAWRVEGDPAATPRWLPASVAIAVMAGTLGLWRALFLGGYAPFSPLPAVVLAAGCVIAPVFGLAVYLAQRGHAQAAALRQSRAFLAEAQRLSRTGSFSWRVATGEIALSDEVYRIFQLDEAVPVTLATIDTRVHPDDVPALYEVIERARGDGGDFEFEHRMLMPGGSVKYLHMVAHAVRDPEGRLEYVGAVQDVTERRLGEEALARVRQELAHVARVTTLGALTASIAHEVNQPLSGIVTNAGTCLRMLAADPPDVDGARETARRTIRDGHRAADVVARLRALFARTDARAEAVDLNEAAREVIALSRSELQRGRVIVRAELDDDLPPVTGDRVQLQQVILNLLLNAADAMAGVDDRPRELVVGTGRDEEDRVRLAVRDAGAGFDPEVADKLFDAFYTTKPHGMGIGLSVSRSIIESHQGRLWAAANEGPGSTFSISLPRRREAAPEPSRPAAALTPAAADEAHAVTTS